MKIKQLFLKITLWIALGISWSYASYATDRTPPEVVWTPTFYAVQPRTDIPHPVSLSFCLTHTPNTLRTTIDQIKKGVKAENDVYIKYLSYTTTHKHGLGFNTVNAEIWIEDAHRKKIWASPLWEYQQNLSETGVTNTVWATSQCKGKFIGVSSIDG